MIPRACTLLFAVLFSAGACAVDTLEMSETESDLGFKFEIAPVRLSLQALFPTTPAEFAPTSQFFRIDNRTSVVRSGWVAAEITPADGSPAYYSEWWRIDNLPAKGWQLGVVHFSAPPPGVDHTLELFYFESTTMAGEFAAPGKRLASTAGMFSTVHATNQCNGAHALCHRRFDEVTFPSTHNAMSNADDHWVLPNHPHGIAAQLAAGIRGMMIDIYWYGGIVRMCHVLCTSGSRPLVDGMRDIVAFLQAHPTEIVTLLFEGGVDTRQVADVFAQAGALPYVYAPWGAWPTLGEMIRDNRRLVVLTQQHDVGGTTVPWYMNQWQHSFENDYEDYLDCDHSPYADRNRQHNALFVFNHFLTPPSWASASWVNPRLLARAQRCQQAFGRRINFLTVDWYTEGDVVGAARVLNGL